ncbi:ATP-dependent RNA helicase DDX51, putative [Plasmodium vinckei lentum]|uniref:ATP-dependent RNA helicase DDX51, putative n=1 Tax=Plasmodium vinckei lentum TaxID=138297 RepID=A0A6V7S2W1_PLAVN|nr:ATP-dependent RNA helicase DDX51, putative [Plasmodium vinckei lentum]
MARCKRTYKGSNAWYISGLYILLNCICKIINEYNCNLSHKRRKKILKDFLSNKINILICMNSIARSLYTANLNYVVNFDIPIHYNVLTNRVGRLSRYNNRKGTVYYFIKRSEKRIMMKSGKRTNVEKINIINQYKVCHYDDLIKLNL